LIEAKPKADADEMKHNEISGILSRAASGFKVIFQGAAGAFSAPGFEPVLRSGFKR